MSESLSSIIDAIKFILEKTPPELSMDIMHDGVCMTGGSTHIKNLDLLIQQETGLSIMKMEEARTYCSKRTWNDHGKSGL